MHYFIIHRLHLAANPTEKIAVLLFLHKTPCGKSVRAGMQFYKFARLAQRYFDRLRWLQCACCVCCLRWLPRYCSTTRGHRGECVNRIARAIQPPSRRNDGCLWAQARKRERQTLIAAECVGSEIMRTRETARARLHTADANRRATWRSRGLLLSSVLLNNGWNVCGCNARTVGCEHANIVFDVVARSCPRRISPADQVAGEWPLKSIIAFLILFRGWQIFAGCLPDVRMRSAQFALK